MSCPRRLSAALQKLTGRGVLSEDDVKDGLREVRRILLEADVSFDLTRTFLERVQEKAVGVLALKSVRPGQQLVKIVYDELVALLGEKQAPIAFASVPPTVVLLVGLQGSGKTTTAGKLAQRLKLEQKAPFLVAADVYRPAAVDQLVALGKQVEVGVYAEPGSNRRGRHRPTGHHRGGKGASPDCPGGHRRPAADRRCDDGRAQDSQGGGEAARDPARCRRDDRSGRGPHR